MKTFYLLSIFTCWTILLSFTDACWSSGSVSSDPSCVSLTHICSSLWICLIGSLCFHVALRFDWPFEQEDMKAKYRNGKRCAINDDDFLHELVNLDPAAKRGRSRYATTKKPKKLLCPAEVFAPIDLLIQFIHLNHKFNWFYWDFMCQTNIKSSMMVKWNKIMKYIKYTIWV